MAIKKSNTTEKKNNKRSIIYHMHTYCLMILKTNSDTRTFLIRKNGTQYGRAYLNCHLQELRRRFFRIRSLRIFWDILSHRDSTAWIQRVVEWFIITKTSKDTGFTTSIAAWHCTINRASQPASDLRMRRFSTFLYSKI